MSTNLCNTSFPLILKMKWGSLYTNSALLFPLSAVIGMSLVSFFLSRVDTTENGLKGHSVVINKGEIRKYSLLFLQYIIILMIVCFLYFQLFKPLSSLNIFFDIHKSCMLEAI